MPRWSADAGDAARGEDGEHAVVVQGVGPALGVGLEPVVPAAQAAEVGAVGRPALGAGVDVVGVGPGGRAAAAGMPAGARSRARM